MSSPKQSKPIFAGRVDVMKTLYGINEPEIVHEDLQDCVVEYLEGLEENEIPEELKVDHYRPREVSTRLLDRVYEGLEESLLEEYGNPDGDVGLPKSVHEAWGAFVDVIKRDYQSWQCEPTGESTMIKTADYL